MDESIPSASLGESNHSRAQEVLLLGLTDTTFGALAHSLISDIGGLDLFVSPSVLPVVQQLQSLGDFTTIPTAQVLLELLIATPAASSLTAIVNRVQSEIDEKMLTDCKDALVMYHARLSQHAIASQVSPSKQEPPSTETLRMWQALAEARKNQESSQN
jgi:hypothetical protein